MQRPISTALTTGAILLAILIIGGCSGHRNTRPNTHINALPPILYVQTWNCGNNNDNVTATLKSDGTLVVSGMGAMQDYDGLQLFAPWRGITDYITGVIIDNGVTAIGNGAFGDLTGLTSVTISGSVNSIGNFAFAGSASVTIPGSVISIGTGALSRTAAINVATDNPHYSSEDGVLFNKTKTVLIQYPQNKQNASYAIPNSVTLIGADAFANCKNLTNVTFGNSVTAIEAFSFAFCYNLESVTISNSVTKIGSGAFAHSGLTTVTSLNPIPPEVTGTNPFFDINENACLYVPANSIEAYRLAEHWKDFKCIKPISVSE